MSTASATEWAVAVASLVASSIVAGAEASLVSLPESRLRALRDQLGEVRGRRLARYLDDPARILTRLLTFRIVAVITASVVVANAVGAGRDPWWHIAVVISVLTLAHGLLAELFITIARARARHIAPYALSVTRPLEILVAPIAKPLETLGRSIRARITQRNTSAPPPVTGREEVEYVLEEAEHGGGLDAREGEMLQNVLDLKDLTARDVMVPRTQMHTIDGRTTLARALDETIAEGHSRVPVWLGQVDNVIGVLHLKDLFHAVHSGEHDGKKIDLEKTTVDALARRPAAFVATGQSVITVLRDMQARRSLLAVVVDEFGALAGLVTLEDLLEQLVGDIQDEHDSEEAPIVDVAEGVWLASADIALSELGERLGVEFPDNDAYASLGGLVTDLAGRVPPVGSTVAWEAFAFTVREGDARHPTKVEITARRASGPGAGQHEQTGG